MTKETDKTKILKDRGMRIRKRREQLKLTQEQLGEKCGWNQKRISFYEAGTREADAESLLILASALEVSISFFYPPEKNLNNVYHFPKKDIIVSQVKKIPLLTQYEAINLGSKEYMEKISNDQTRKFIPVPSDTPDYFAAIQVIDDSMTNPDKSSHRNFFSGDIAMVDTLKKPELTNIVLALVPHAEKAIIRQYSFNQDSKKHQLIPFNAYYPVVDIDESILILGVVTQKVTLFI